MKQDAKKYYLENKVRMSSKMKEWRLKNPNYQKEWYLKNKEKASEEGKKWRESNREKTKTNFSSWYEKNRDKKMAQNKEWSTKNREARNVYRNKYRKARRVVDYKFRLEQNIGNFIKLSIKQKKKGMRWEKLVEYSLEELIIHLEKQFDSNMTWGNYGSYWHIDHKKPRSWFKYLDADDIEFKKCWRLKNLQPLEAKENNKKGNKYESK